MAGGALPKTSKAFGFYSSRFLHNPKNHAACLEKPSHESAEPCLRIVWVAELVQHDALPAGLQRHRDFYSALP